ncbi:MAG: hypothetical protein FWD43_02945 [Coriobacteriia bacterium]|nr:hypothetical protein [Coriobacteriia bacterium]
MPALQVRDFPEQLYEELRVCAKREHRSIAQQTIVAVQDYVRQEDERLSKKMREVELFEMQKRRQKILEKLDALPTFTVPEGFPTPEEIVREMRDSR